MSSKIIRGEAGETPQTPAWTTWSTERIDTGARPAPGPEAAIGVAEEVRRRIEEQVEAARKEGFREGEQAARQACRRELEESARQMAQAVQNALREKSRLRAEAERDVVALVLAIARKILRREVRIDPGVALGLVKAAMETVNAREILAVRTTPQMAQALNSGLAGVGLPEAVRVVADPSLELGGLVVETQRGEVDASLETQFEEISRGLLEAAGESGRQA